MCVLVAQVDRIALLEFLHVVGWEERWRRRDELTQLHVGGAELLAHAAEQHGWLRNVTGRDAVDGLGADRPKRASEVQRSLEDDLGILLNCKLEKLALQLARLLRSQPLQQIYWRRNRQGWRAGGLAENSATTRRRHDGAHRRRRDDDACDS